MKEPDDLETPAVFSFIGATPRTDWLPVEIEQDAKGFVRTGAALAESPHWGAARTPLPARVQLIPGYSRGDVRCRIFVNVARRCG